jgi:DNA-binding response OmpR family regulator
VAFKPKILIIEDDPALMSTIKITLSTMESEVVSAPDSKAGAEYITTEKFDGVFLDCRLPGIDGLQLGKMVRSSGLNKSCTLVMLADGTDAEALKESFKLGANFVLQKPIKAGHIRSMLNASRGMMLEERRRFQRATSDFILHCSWGETNTQGICVDISATGLQADLRDTPVKGTEVTLEFSLPEDATPLKLFGKVTRITEDETAGIQFINPAHSQRKQIMQFTDKAHGTAVTV